MIKFFKIKVGIEEFSVEEKDVPRIIEAMKSNDMVKLDCGIFRGNAILAICRDEEKEEQSRLLAFDSSIKTPEELQEIENEKIIKEQRMQCELCDHTGWKEGKDYIRRPCDCMTLKTSIII